MAKNVNLLGVDYNDVPATTLPQTGGGVVKFIESSELDGMVVDKVENQSIVEITDGSANPVKKLVLTLTPIQSGSGDPFPPGGGKNKLSDVWSEYTRPNDYYIYPISLTQGNKYYISATLIGTAVSGIVVALVKDGDRYTNFVGQTNIINTSGEVFSRAFLIDATYTNPKIAIYCSGGTQFNQIFANYHIQLEIGDTATSYAPYSNIRPITGHDGVTVSRTGKNLCEGKTNNLISISSTEASVINGTGTCLVVHLVKDQSYVFSNPDLNRRVVSYWDELPSVGDKTPYFQSLTGNTFTAIRSGLALIYIYNSDVDTSQAQVELGSTATAYEPYSGTTYPFTFPATVYGGELDTGAGEVTTTWGHIASYNGESLPGRWISDRDVYVAGTTPTTGAEVVYELATPTTASITPQQIETLEGVNNVWADEQNSEIKLMEYIVDMDLFMQRKYGIQP